MQHHLALGMALSLCLGAAAGWAVTAAAAHRREQSLLTMAHTDEMTGLLNRAAARSAVDRALAEDCSGALLMLDVDHFKQANDRHGHLFGDNVLQSVAAALRCYAGAGEIAGRVGGDEFVLFLPGRDLRAATDLAEILRCALAQNVVISGRSWSMTVSIGIATARSGLLFDDLYRQADAALYQSKLRGRNCSTAYTPEQI